MNCRRKLHNVARTVRTALGLLALTIACENARAQEFRYTKKIVVAEPTTLDWPYAVLGTSPSTIPPKVLSDSKRGGPVSYEFFGPADNDRAGRPLVIFVSPQDRPVGWDFWADACEAHGVLFAGVRDAGNGVPEARRIRAVVETLADVRRRHSVSVEQTYLAGFSGGAHIAWRVASALPEEIGGVICIGYAPRPPDSAWQRQRMADRLSIAIIIGDREPATAWVESLYGPLLKEHGVRTAVKVLARHGHSMPGPSQMEAAFNWLEQASNARAADVKRNLGLNRFGGQSREETAASFLSGAKSVFVWPESTAVGLASLAEVVQRWPDLPAAREAQTLLAEYDQKPERPWLVEQERRRIKILQIEAGGFDRLARRNEMSLRADRGLLIGNAQVRWEELARSDDPKLRGEAKEHLVELIEWAAHLPATDAKIAPVPLAKVRFELIGDVTLAEAVERFRKVLAQLGYALEVDEDAATIVAAGKEQLKLDLPAATFTEVDRRFFRRHGLKLVRSGSEVKLTPVKPNPPSNEPNE